MSLRDKIQAIDDTQKEVVNIKVWDADVEVRSLTGMARASLMTKSMDKDGKVIQEQFHQGLVVNTCFDPETGDQLFTLDDTWLMEKNASAIEKLVAAAMRVSGLAVGDVEDAEKN